MLQSGDAVIPPDPPTLASGIATRWLYTDADEVPRHLQNRASAAAQHDAGLAEFEALVAEHRPVSAASAPCAQKTDGRTSSPPPATCHEGSVPEDEYDTPHARDETLGVGLSKQFMSHIHATQHNASMKDFRQELAEYTERTRQKLKRAEHEHEHEEQARRLSNEGVPVTENAAPPPTPAQLKQEEFRRRREQVALLAEGLCQK